MKTKTTELVCFTFRAPGAKEVCIAGSFNDWHPSVTPMISTGSGQWSEELTLAPGRYEYRFVVDGQWVDDPAAKELVANPFGGANAVLEVRSSPRNKPARSGSKSDAQAARSTQGKLIRQIVSQPVQNPVPPRTSATLPR